MTRVLHIWEKYLPGLFDETHPYCLEKDPNSSYLVAARFVSSGVPLPNTFSMEVQERRIATNPTILERLLLRLQDKTFWKRFNDYCYEQHEKIQPTVIHLHFGNTAAKLLPFLMKVNTPALVSFYGNDASESIQRPEFQRLYPLLFRRVSKVFVLCEEVALRLEKLKCPREKLVQIQLPAGIEAYPYKERIPGKTVRFLTCARFVEKKGHPLLIEAIKSLRTKGLDVTLTMMGYGPLKPSFLAQGIQEQSFPIRLIDTELAPDFAKTYYEALCTHDIFVLPSLKASNGDDEGGPALTLVCAQAAGVPVICSDFPGSEISVTENETGFVVPQNDTQALVEKMEWLAKNPEVWNSIGKASHEKVNALFGRDTQMQRMYGFYSGVSAERSKSDTEEKAIPHTVFQSPQPGH